MNISNIRSLLRSTCLGNIPLRVTYYARVSPENKEEANRYETLIAANENWTLIPGYADESQNGLFSENREHFDRMIQDAARGRFDLIIAGELSCFAGNSLASIRYARKLLEHGTGVLFQTDNINTLEEDSELRLAIMESIAQDEMERIHSRIHFADPREIQELILQGGRIFACTDKTGRLVIDATQADLAQEVFALY